MRNRQANRKFRLPHPLWFGVTLAAAILLAACAPVMLNPTPTPEIQTPVPTLAASPTPSSSPAPTLTISPTAAPTSRPECADMAGIIEEVQVDTPLMYDPFQFKVYLPPCYDQDIDRDFPLLILFHGIYNTDDQWIRIGAIEVADRLIISGGIAPFILVMPYDPNIRQPSETPFDELFMQELLPYIEANYRVKNGANYHALGGLSRGAGWAIHFGFQYPQMFAAIGAHSPIIFWEDSQEIKKWLDAIPAKKLPRIYLDIGEKDPESEAIIKLESMFTDLGIPFDVSRNPGYHNELYWHSQVESYIRWYAAGW